MLADTYARYQAGKGNDVRFQAGTDEHGNKIYKKAKELGIPTQEYVDQNSQKFQDFIKKLGSTYKTKEMWEMIKKQMNLLP